MDTFTAKVDAVRDTADAADEGDVIIDGEDTVDEFDAATDE